MLVLTHKIFLKIEQGTLLKIQWPRVGPETTLLISLNKVTVHTLKYHDISAMLSDPIPGIYSIDMLLIRCR